MAISTAVRSNLAVLTQRRAEERRRPAAEARLHPVPPTDAAEAKRVLIDALGSEPTLRWCFDAEDRSFARRLRAYVEVGHNWHCAQGYAVQGAYAGGELLGVAYLAAPEAEVEVDFEPYERELLAACGEDCIRRFARYNRAVASALPEGRMFTLALLGVRKTLQGRGIGTRLLGWVNGVCDADNRAAGVILDTAAGHGASLYGRMGYREIAKVAVSNDRRQSVFFRPRLSLLA